MPMDTTPGASEPAIWTPAARSALVTKTSTACEKVLRTRKSAPPIDLVASGAVPAAPAQYFNMNGKAVDAATVAQHFRLPGAPPPVVVLPQIQRPDGSAGRNNTSTKKGFNIQAELQVPSKVYNAMLVCINPSHSCICSSNPLATGS